MLAAACQGATSAYRSSVSTASVVMTTAHRVAAYSRAIRWCVRGEVGDRVGHQERLDVVGERVDGASSGTPTWAYTPQMTSWSRPCSRIRSSRSERWKAL